MKHRWSPLFAQLIAFSCLLVSGVLSDCNCCSVLKLHHVIDPNEKTQVMTTFGWMTLVWEDELLTWDPAKFGGLSRLVVPPQLIWLPEIAMFNSVEEGNDLSMTSKFRVSILPDGTVTWAPGFKWQTSCTVDLVTFPYDSQECNVTFVNWVYQATQLNFSLLSDSVDLHNYERNEEWEVVSTKTSRKEIVAKDFSVPFVTFTLSLTRRPEFYLFNVLVPSIIMTLISSLVFCLPAESGEKISMGITVLLSYSVILLMVSDITPRSSSVPLITLYIVTNMGLTASSLIFTVVILNVFHHNPLKPVPSWMNVFSRCLCLGSLDKDKMAGVRQAPWSGSMYVGEALNFEVMKTRKAKQGLQYEQELRLPYALWEYFMNAKEKELDNEVIEKNRADWQRLAAALDRLFFILFCLVIFIIGTSVMTIMQADAMRNPDMSKLY